MSDHECSAKFRTHINLSMLCLKYLNCNFNNSSMNSQLEPNMPVRKSLMHCHLKQFGWVVTPSWQNHVEFVCKAKFQDLVMYQSVVATLIKVPYLHLVPHIHSFNNHNAESQHTWTSSTPIPPPSNVITTVINIHHHHRCWFSFFQPTSRGKRPPA